MGDDIGHRKDEHIRINLEEDVSFAHLTPGLEHYHFIHQALPELDLEAVRTEVTFLGHRLTFPLLIGSMTGGSPAAGRINRILAEAAQQAGVGLALGSIRAALEQPQWTWTFQVRDAAPDCLLLVNLGAIQLNYGYGVEECRRALELSGADGLILHLNPLQEALQPEGNTRFGGLLRRIETICAALTAPVIVKEVGHGLSEQAARQLMEAGVAALDVAGAGGTSWSQVELHRSETPRQQEIAAAFRDWGIPTAEALHYARRAAPQLPLIASGGLRTGVDIAKSLALGADLASMAGVLLPAAVVSTEAVLERLGILEAQLRIAMFAAGAGSIADLQHTPLVKDPA
ncbi:MAG TPA: type 2 isopentenyl-diphosphate Delta-isomerase [Anaerolineae bacterium]|nr:type 2 isopentenyl-diphosphate Delta-isomerase [Anaerolineae bacterium]